MTQDDAVFKLGWDFASEQVIPFVLGRLRLPEGTIFLGINQNGLFMEIPAEAMGKSVHLYDPNRIRGTMLKTYRILRALGYGPEKAWRLALKL